MPGKKGNNINLKLCLGAFAICEVGGEQCKAHCLNKKLMGFKRQSDERNLLLATYESKMSGCVQGQCKGCAVKTAGYLSPRV